MHQQEHGHQPIDPIAYLRQLKIEHPQKKGAHMGVTEEMRLPGVISEFFEEGKPEHLTENEWGDLWLKFLNEELNDEEKTKIERAWQDYVEKNHIQLAA